VLIGYALLCPLAAALILFGLPAIAATQPAFIIGALAFSAGIFLCIALSDLLPEIHFHSHDRVKMTLVLLLGIVLSYALRSIEAVHKHDVHANTMQLVPCQHSSPLARPELVAPAHRQRSGLTHGACSRVYTPRSKS
ncbi:MAG: ZIP family metal transporter, partial [Gammaproteobacteria bacterium]|nr:ZIP family metal transporter [Gammaproteobacteria bacterium]